MKLKILIQINQQKKEMSYLQTKLLTHRQQVLKLYKAAVKNERSWHPDRY